jgi:hypothetical protein
MFILSAMSSVTTLTTKLAGAPDVAGRVLGNKVLVGPIGYAHADDGRVGAQVVVGTERRRIQVAVLIHAGDERNRPRRNQAHEQLVGLSGRTPFEIKIHRSAHS